MGLAYILGRFKMDNLFHPSSHRLYIAQNYHCHLQSPEPIFNFFYMRRVSVKRMITIFDRCLWFAATVLLILRYCSNGVQGSQQVPALYVFGDSLVDTGNNNNLNSIAKSNYLPYGCDFNRGPTGRFSNGKTIVDMLDFGVSGEMLGVPSPPAVFRSHNSWSPNTWRCELRFSSCWHP
ncbi:hypothetical protein L1049_026093 [Liquidambar formosana]|uniref:GDSL esterase/lipase n=1 Tax=Liquidambar formosana TaxID=63359 RepID=A0AAP0NC46_LIQFO